MSTVLTSFLLLGTLAAAAGVKPIPEPGTSSKGTPAGSPPHAMIGGEKEKSKPARGQGHFTIGKDTTYVTGPLDADGYVDYAAALNKRLNKGVTPANNANVLLWKAIGPHPEGATMPPEFFKLLSMAAPPANGQYFIPLAQFLKEDLKIETAQEMEAVLNQLTPAMERPWTAKDFPALASWLKANEKPLAVVTQASERPRYFSPLVPPPLNQQPAGLFVIPLPEVQTCRQLATALLARAMFRLDQGDTDGAWQDLLACHRLGLLVGRGATLIEGLVGLAIDATASRGELAFLDRARPDARRLKTCQRDLEALPPLPSMADKVDLVERFAYLDTILMMDRQGARFLEGFAGKGAEANLFTDLLLKDIDWDPALREGNRWYDRLAAAMREKDRAAREKKLEEIDKELKALRTRTMGYGGLARMFLAGPSEQGKAMGDALICLVAPAVQKVSTAADRTGQVEDNTLLAFALARYQRDHGRYPKELEALVPGYLARVPQDRFSGKTLVYHPAGDGYLLYSVGPNGKDDQGHGPTDTPPGDDLSVRMQPEVSGK
ncbi:MAG: hypothetical protein JO112_19800 [Planctomycetes bacterium]|nr:hypothetical protein [Planctomycetota bacterium]